MLRLRLRAALLAELPAAAADAAAVVVAADVVAAAVANMTTQRNAYVRT